RGEAAADEAEYAPHRDALDESFSEVHGEPFVGSRGRQSTRAIARTGEPSAPVTRRGRAMNRQRAAPMRSRFVRYSITVMPRGKNAWCVVHSSFVTLVSGEKIPVRMQ